MENAGKGTAILVHGLWMNAPSFLPMAKRLEGQGYAVLRHGYASCRDSLDQNTAQLADFLLHTRQAPGPVHILGHSMGGVLALSACIQAGPPGNGQATRLLMMGSPYQNAHCAATLSRVSLLAPLFGHTLPQWLARPRPLPPDWLEVGILAGTLARGLGRLFVPSLPEPNDGVVALAETVVPGAKDSLCLDVSHMGMLLSKRCAAQAGHFFEHGGFLHEARP